MRTCQMLRVQTSCCAELRHARPSIQGCVMLVLPAYSHVHQGADGSELSGGMLPAVRDDARGGPAAAVHQEVDADGQLQPRRPRQLQEGARPAR